MTLEEFKKQIENKTLDDSSYIIQCSDSFIMNQYINEIARFKLKKIEYIDSIDSLFDRNPFLVYNDIYVVRVNELDTLPYDLSSINNAYIFCNKTKLPCITIPKIENWQVEDYAITNLPSVNKSLIIELCKNANWDINRISNEIDKLNLFKNQELMLKEFISDGVYSDMSNINIFDITNAIENKDFLKLSSLYHDINNSNTEPLAIITTLYNAYRKILILMTTKNPTEATTGIKSNQIWALKQIASKYSGVQILNVLRFLSTLQDRLVNGELPQNLLLDYTILNILKIIRS